MDLRYSPEDERFRVAAREWLTNNVPDFPLPSGDTREGFAVHLDWERKLFEAGWAVVSWPEAYGGRDASLWQWLIFEEEYYRARAPQRVTQNGIFLLAPTLFEFGTPKQKSTILPRMAAAIDVWAQGWSEPEAGSDLASVSSRAVRDAKRGGWRLSGQKTWTTRGAFCTHMFGLFRSDQSSRRHRGLTYFMVPLDADGVNVSGFARLDGDEGFADVYLDEVFVDDDAVLGGVGEGWTVAMSTTGSERGLSLRSPGRFRASAEDLLQLASEEDARMHGDRRDRLVQAWIDAYLYEQFTLEQVTRLLDGEDPGAASSLNKLFWSQLDVRLHELAMELLGTESELDGPWPRGYMFSLAGPIYAGTNEIQRTILAERVLGLPRG